MRMVSRSNVTVALSQPDAFQRPARKSKAVHVSLISDNNVKQHEGPGQSPITSKHQAEPKGQSPHIQQPGNTLLTGAQAVTSHKTKEAKHRRARRSFTSSAAVDDRDIGCQSRGRQASISTFCDSWTTGMWLVWPSLPVSLPP
jgi:hypothetical protein